MREEHIVRFTRSLEDGEVTLALSIRGTAADAQRVGGLMKHAAITRGNGEIVARITFERDAKLRETTVDYE